MTQACHKINTFRLLRSDTEGKRQLSKLLGTELYTSYDNLIDHIRNISETDDSLKDCTLRDILMGNNLSLTDKKSAVYEFPTFELVETLFALGKFAGAKHFNEMFSGTGILSRSIDNYNSKVENDEFKFNTITCSDGNFEWNTCGFKFCDVKEQCLYEMMTIGEQKDYSDTMFVFSWCEHEHIHQIKNFLKYVKPKCLVVVDNNDHKNEQIYEDYSYKEFYVKQLCYRDTEMNYSVDNKTSHSNIGVFIKGDDIPNTVITDKYKLNNFTITDRTIVEDLMEYNTPQREIYEHILKNQEEISNWLKKMYKYKLFSIPEFITNRDDFIKYIEMCDILKLKISIKNKGMFNELSQLIEKYKNCSIETYNEAVNDGIIPRFIPINNVLDYLIAEFIGVKKDDIHRLLGQ